METRPTNHSRALELTETIHNHLAALRAEVRAEESYVRGEGPDAPARTTLDAAHAAADDTAATMWRTFYAVVGAL